ncbi:hypothetical protein V6N11_009509 [Hibiscus sabdariffa]|uniref:Rad60/SUMO-like domain-containing protein n=1 Tax=Hibiscus sabdariffa TaxID=183260 RepID=A0ABR2P5K9_9ROSI
MQRSGSNGGVSSGSAGEEIINRAGGRERRITIHVTGQDGSTTMFTISRNLRLRVLFLNYCERKQLNYRTARFLHQGVRVLGRRTPAELNLEDGVELNCMLHQLGGGGFYTMPATT